ncbi:MAG: 3D domain-containing protein [Nitrosopumilus sp.]|nr:3D domain-containing protein [Nitrosopumilus sp.]MDH3385165.1 3D domain-containing protein [Nitrosopumilus sp.]
MLIRHVLILGIVIFFSTSFDSIFAEMEENNPVIPQFSTCSVPISGNWIISSDCTLSTSTTVTGNVWIQNNSVLTIPNEITLYVDFENSNLKVFSGSGLLIQFGGTIKQTDSTLDKFNDCSPGWDITGYYIPLESDYEGDFFSIIIDGESRDFREDFIDSIMIEGWGKTLSGDYLGWYSNSFHINDNAVDADGNPLVVGIVAVDTSIVDPNTNLIIPTLPDPWNEFIFLSSDVGSGVIGKHIDVFTGVGNMAEQETFQITSSGNTVCQ